MEFHYSVSVSVSVALASISALTVYCLDLCIEYDRDVFLYNTVRTGREAPVLIRFQASTRLKQKNKESPSSSTRSRTPSRPRSANLGDGHGRGAAHFVRQRWACFWVSGTQRDQISMSINFRCLC